MPIRMSCVDVRRARWLTATLVLLLGACGEDDDSGISKPQPPPPPPAPAPLSLAGSPPASVLENASYDFIPTVSHVPDRTVTFSIVNRPPWALFSSASGRLQGTPRPEDLGTYEDIVITVSDGSRTSSLGPFSISVVATAPGSVRLSWLAPTQRANGEPLAGDLAGYNVYWGIEPHDFPQVATVANPGITTYVIEPLTPGTWYFAVTAFDNAGRESAPSNVGAATIR